MIIKVKWTAIGRLTLQFEGIVMLGKKKSSRRQSKHQTKAIVSNTLRNNREAW